MRIAIAGAHRVGKTTLVEKLYESLPGYEYIIEPYYELEEMGYNFPEIPTVDDYLTQLEYSIKRIAIKENNVIFDRCPIDLFAYIQATDEATDLQSLYSKVRSAMDEIDLLVFVPVEKPDLIPCRDAELPELRFQVNEILCDLIGDFDMEAIEVRGTISERLSQIKDRIVIATE